MTLGRLAAGGLAAATAGLAYGWWEARWFTLRELQVEVLDCGQPEIRVLHLSDIHLVARQHRKLDYLSSLARLEPDLVINTGDNLGSPAALEVLLEAMDGLLGVPGAYVFGSNDWQGPVRFTNPLRYLAGDTSQDQARGRTAMPAQELTQAFTAAGWADLNNARAELEVAAGLLVELRGTGDAHHDLDDYGRVQGSRSPKAQLSVGVTHAPYRRVLDAMTADDLDVIFAGHTHGGQVCLPGYGALLTNCDLPTHQASGLSRWRFEGHESWLHVSAGIGTSPSAAYRMACRPGATMVHLVPRQN